MADAVIRVDQHSQATSVNWMPFGIAHDGPSNAGHYFQPTTAEETSSNTSHLAAHFRGRRLKGVQKQLPEGYHGLILKPCGAQSSTSTADTEQRSWQACKSFQQLVVWNHDTAPAATDWHMRCIDWLALADKVHAPIDPAQVNKELQCMQHQQ